MECLLKNVLDLVVSSVDSTVTRGNVSHDVVCGVDIWPIQ